MRTGRCRKYDARDNGYTWEDVRRTTDQLTQDPFDYLAAVWEGIQILISYRKGCVIKHIIQFFSRYGLNNESIRSR